MKISYQNIEDILVTALEGGSNYWYFLEKDSIRIIIEATPQLSEEPLAVRLAWAVWKSEVVVPVYDLEGRAEKLGDITKSSLKSAIKAYQEDRKHFDPGLIDADEADWIFQHAVMGEIVFG